MIAKRGYEHLRTHIPYVLSYRAPSKGAHKWTVKQNNGDIVYAQVHGRSPSVHALDVKGQVDNFPLFIDFF
ncbi:hypothetical protein EDM58_08055 [Brevibacillus panacihumi]|uniref:Uncharacterized protein n=1 Tax=Brevibacillus panacihumi TaxID=497735 RepID=A0A3M8CYS3_9BACL|nr:hypothetical protein EDM58_08055 [Brevibacillus panacihumi]